MASFLSLDLDTASLSSHETFTKKCNVSPLTLLTVLDHYTRCEANEAVIGILLGTVSNGSQVEVENSFILKVKGDEDDERDPSILPVVDHDNLNQRLGLAQRLNPKHSIVGWYLAGPLASWAEELHQDIQRETIGFQAVFLHIDVELLATAHQFPLAAYVGAPAAVPMASEPKYLFVPIPCVNESQDVAGLEFLNQSSGQDQSNVASLEQALLQIRTMLDTLQTHVDQVVNGSTPGDEATGRYISDTLSLVQHLDKESFSALFQSHRADLDMVAKLAALTKTQLSIATNIMDKL
ncbi:hypothetical protein HDV03_001624 [Kappamyces sp. JEL0829]|nr:hypothetical protein HDV03_001624 [Kappamyces sp. JEL0829]